MARRLRVHCVDHPLHVIQRGVDRSACFACPADYGLYLGMLGELAPQWGCDVHAYVLMPNHVHLLLTPRADRACSALMKDLGQRYAQAINKRWRRSGPLWEGRYKSSLVDSDSYALNCQRYIECNPVRAGMVRHASEYAWSSYRCNALGAHSRLLAPVGAYSRLGADGPTRRLAYRQLFGEGLTDAVVRRIREAARGEYVLGSPAFIEEMMRVLGRRALPRQPPRASGTA